MADIDKLQLLRGNEVNLPALDIAEPAFTTNTKKLFIGSDEGNIEFAKQEVLDAHINNYAAHINKESIVRSGKDANKMFTTITMNRADATKYFDSVLSGGTSPNYTTRTENFYDVDGITVLETRVYTLTYDSDGDFLTEIPV